MMTHSMSHPNLTTNQNRELLSQKFKGLIYFSNLEKLTYSGHFGILLIRINNIRGKYRFIPLKATVNDEPTVTDPFF